jgi:very-short-patch-repair endonuclease
VLRKEEAKAKREALEMAMAQQLRAAGIPFQREVMFHPSRKWRFDFALDGRLALEVDGAIFSQGRHVRGQGYSQDCRKDAEAMMLGWRVLRVTGEHVRSGEALRWVEGCLAAPLSPAVAGLVAHHRPVRQPAEPGRTEHQV